MTQYVFICHATEDKAVATVICEALEARGVRCWIAPRNIKPGADYGGAIIKAIGEARALVLVLSTHSNESEHVKREVERAVSRGVSVIPFRIEEILPSEALEYFISSTQWVDAFTPPLEKHVGYLVENLKEGALPEAKEVKVADPEPPTRPRAETPQARNWLLTVPGLVTVAAAVVLVVAGLFIVLYKTGTFSWPEKAASPETPGITEKLPAAAEKAIVGKASPEQVFTEEAPSVDEGKADDPTTKKPHPTTNVLACKSFQGTWEVHDLTPMRLTQAGCSFEGSFDSLDHVFSHVLHGKADRSPAQIIVDRRDGNGCSTKLFGSVQLSGDHNTLIWNISRTAGRCGLDASYSEHREWRRR